jgi:hypothetical protein
MGGVAPNPGTTALVGYGGGFVSEAPVDPADLTKGTIQTIYCPYELDSDGVPAKAHIVTLDPTEGNENVTIAHGEGMAIIMMKGESSNDLTIKSTDGSNSILINDDGVSIQAKQINLLGGVVIGEALAAVPMLAGVASPPCSKLFLSP